MMEERRLGRLRASIFTRLLVALLLVALLPLTAFWQLERERMIDNGEAGARQRLELFADSAVQQVDAWMRLNLSVLQLAASESAVRSMRPQEQLKVIEEVRRQLPWAYLIHTVDLTGRNVARSDGRPLNWYGDRQYFREVMAGRPYGVEIQIGRTSHRPAFLLAVPIKNPAGELTGMLIEAATLDHVTRAVISTRLGHTGHAFLMTNTGLLIADRGVPMLTRLRNFRDHPAYAAAQRGDGFYHYRYQGVDKVAEIHHTDFGWIVVAQQAQAESMAAVSQTNRYAWLLLGLTTLTVTVISALVARGFARRIARHTRALEAAKAEAEQANRSKTSFVAAAVHDLMQPLNAARMFVDAARARLTAAAGQEVVNGIDSALAAEDEILSTLLDISRLESGTLEVHERDFPLAALLETLGREFGVIARARGMKLRVVRCGATVRSDEALLRRILQNYLSNAVRYGRGGRILMGCRRAAGRLRIEVWDRGPGIAPEHHRRIFHEFQRLDTGHPSEGGAGLGLAIVERIATRLGHRIGLRSWVGWGSVFFVEVPRVEAAVPARRASAPPLPPPSASGPGAERDPQSPLAGRRVFSVEDDPRVRHSVHTLLSGWGCEVMLASGVQEALRLATHGAIPDLLLLDYRLPDGKGPELVPELFRQWGSEVPVLVMSAEPDAAVRQNVEANGWSFLAKPVSPSKLRAALTHLLMRRAAPV